MMKIRTSHWLAGLLMCTGGIAYASDHAGWRDDFLRGIYDDSVRMSDKVEFLNTVHADAAKGQTLFGVAGDGHTIDNSGALFVGNSVIFGQVTSNGTACATCHQPEWDFKLPPTPISQHVDADDPLRTGRNAEAQGDPRAAGYFENLALVKQRPGRFNPVLPESSPFRQLVAWRKTQTVWNMAFANGLLTDGRARGPIEQARGAVFNHTQDTDKRFDDIANPALAPIVAYQQTLVSPPELKDLLDPAAPLHDVLATDPFYTVHPTTAAEREGQDVFEKSCMSCHNMPNVFSAREHVDGPGPNFPPLYGKTYDIGVAQANMNHLDYRYYDADTGQYATTVLPLAREDGALVNVPVVDDVGAAGTTARLEDMHRFKVPQLRRIAKLAPYFHDNSAPTLEDVVDYFNSDAYNNSADGRNHPIHLGRHERSVLLAFLRIL